MHNMKTYNRMAAILLFLALPLLFWALGDTPRRSFLKEIISIITILGYFLMLGQFFISRGNQKVLKTHKTGKVVHLHKVIGYIFIPILLLHPFLMVVPRFFEAGITPIAAFTTIITTWDSQGLVLGMIAWMLMLILGLTSIFRKKMGMKYTTWRIFHGILSMAFILLATWHAMDLGRHTDLPMSLYMGAIAGLGILFLLRTYLFNPAKKAEYNV
jgi:predicted ferric reductase